MDTTSASNVLPADTVLSYIDTSIRNLHELRNIILQREETLPQGTSVDEKQQRKVRRIQYSVLDQIKVLEKVFKNVFQLDQTMEDADPDPSFAQQGRTVVEADPAVPMLVSNPAETKESAGQFKSEISMNESETKEPRYLYLSDGLVICCLELKQRKHQSYDDVDDVPPLPKIATLKLMDAGFPIAAGLFKLGSDAYMIGGQELPPCYPEPSKFTFQRSKPCGAELYRYITRKHKIRGSSCVTYRLSRDDGGIVPISDDILTLKDPKIWPVIEKIDDRLHVINSIPRMCPIYMGAETGISSHEILNPDELGQGWTRIPTTDAIGEGEIVSFHLAVGNRIYLTTSDDYMMFDSTTNKWEARPIQKEREPLDPFCVEHVFHILKFGNGRCVGKFLPSEDPLFIVIALVMNMNIATFDYSPHAVAYLVSPTGRVLCFQRLPHFFGGDCDGCLRPDFYRDSTVIRVDEQGEMMCAIVHARALGKLYLFINMFAVEGLDDSASKVAEVLNDSASKFAVELEFVRVVVKERYVFETDSDADLRTFARVQACFI